VFLCFTAADCGQCDLASANVRSHLMRHHLTQKLRAGQRNLPHLTHHPHDVERCPVVSHHTSCPAGLFPMHFQCSVWGRWAGGGALLFRWTRLVTFSTHLFHAWTQGSTSICPIGRRGVSALLNTKKGRFFPSGCYISPAAVFGGINTGCEYTAFGRPDASSWNTDGLDLGLWSRVASPRRTARSRAIRYTGIPSNWLSVLGPVDNLNYVGASFSLQAMGGLSPANHHKH
jgi:hypothetical protein